MDVIHFFIILILFNAIDTVQSYYRLDLGGSWTIKDPSSGIKCMGHVPGSMYTALLDQGVIQDPLYRKNDVDLAWIGQTNWTYSSSFTFNPSKSITSLLVCEGLDTLATITINGKTIGQTDNMFVKYIFDITDVIQPNRNDISVQFISAVNEASRLANSSSYDIPPDCPPSVQNGQCHVNYLRKEQCSFSWDWGPSFPTQGIWKPIYVENFYTAVISELTAVVSKVNFSWLVTVEVGFFVAKNSEVKGQLYAGIAALNVSLSQQVVLTSNTTVATFTLDLPSNTSINLWWPQGYGSQALYNLSVTFTSGSDKSFRQIRIGFRSVELIQEPVSNNTQQGLSFYFRINGIPIFLKGSNWIPADSFQERITYGKLKYLLTSAKLVNINSLRVWGGGVYESDEFYSLCDELGILIWQDFMFSVAMYPTRPEFLNSISFEINHQIQRLKHHPSILIWAGNNENEKGLRQNWFDTDKNFTLYYNDYIKLYVDTIKPIVNQKDWSRQYLTSSPTNGKESEKEGYVAADPDSELYGDIHYYNYLVDQWDVGSFRIPRMASEYGIQAWCNNETLASVFLPSDFDMKCDMVRHRQHHADGNLEMAVEVGLHLNQPTSQDPAVRFRDFIYLTQINQAMSIRTQTEHYRRHQSQLLSDGRGLTMGALYWQLNDIWQAPTWASIDYSGSWKMLHYYAKSFFSNVLISPYYLDSSTVDVFIVVDEIAVKEVRDQTSNALHFEPVKHHKDLKKSAYKSDIFQALEKSWAATEGVLKIDMYLYSSFKPKFSWSVPYKLKSTSESVFQKPVIDLLSESSCPAKEKCILHFTSLDSSGSTTSTTWFALTYPKYSVLPPANVKISSITKVSAGVYDIILTTDAVALYVWLSTDAIIGYFSDNGFLMLSDTVTLTFTSVSDVSVDQLNAQLRVRSLADVKTSS